MSEISYNLTSVQSSEYYVAVASYYNGVFPTSYNTGLTLQSNLSLGLEGINAYVYKDIYNHIFIGIEGTDLSLSSFGVGSLSDDLNIGFINQVPSLSYDTLNAFIQPYIKEYGNNNVYVSGHSLGGTFAEELAAQNNLPGMSIAGTSIPITSQEKNNSNYNNFNSYIGYGDPVANYNGMLGNFTHYGISYNIGSQNLEYGSFIDDFHHNSFSTHGISIYNQYFSPNLDSNRLKYIADNTQSLLNEEIKKQLNILSKITDPIIIYSDRPSIINVNLSLYQYDYSNGVYSKTSWIGYGNDTNFLVTLDKNGQPVLLGNSTSSGYSMLSQYDTNKDNVINASDSGFNQLYLWNGQDIGNVQSGDLQTLQQAGIESISLNTTAQNIDENGSTLTATSNVTMADGSKQTAGEFNLATDSTYTLINIDQDISNGTLSTTATVNGQSVDLTTLPNLHGYGTLSSLLGTMASGDTQLITDVKNFNNLTMSTSWNTVYSDVKNILLEWGNYQTSNFTLPDGTKGPTQFTSGNQELNFLDNYMGSVIHFDATNSDTSYYLFHQIILDSAYNMITIDAIAKLALQGPYKELQTYFTYDESNDTIVMKDTDANTLQALMNQYLSAYTPNYYNNTGTDSATAFWRVVSILFEAGEETSGESLITEFNNLKTINADMAQYIVNSEQNLNFSGYYEEVTGKMTGGQTYIWNPDKGMGFSNINPLVSNNYVNNYIYQQAQKGNYNLPENVELQQDTVVVNSNIEDITFSVNGSNNDQIWLTYNNNNLYFDPEGNFSNFIFNNGSILQTANELQTGYNATPTENNFNLLGINDRVTFNSKGYVGNIYNVGLYNNIIFNQGYKDITLYNGTDKIIINAGYGLQSNNTIITGNSNNLTINFGDINTGNINIDDKGGGTIEIDYLDGEKSFILSDNSILNNNTITGENINIYQTGFGILTLKNNISFSNISYYKNNNIITLQYLNQNNISSTMKDVYNNNTLEIQLSYNSDLFIVGNTPTENNQFNISTTGWIVDSLGNGGYYRTSSNYNDFTDYLSFVLNIGYSKSTVNISVSNFHFFIQQNIMLSDITLLDTNNIISLGFTDFKDVENKTGFVNIINPNYNNIFLNINSSLYSIVYKTQDDILLTKDFVSSEDNQTLDSKGITENIILNNRDTINFNSSYNTLFVEMDNANSFTLKMDTSLNQINIEKIDDMRVNIETNSNQNGNVIVSFDQYSSVGMVKTIQIQATDLNEQIVYDNQYYPDYNSNGEQTYLILSSSIQTSNNIEFNSGYKNLTIDNLNNYLNINLNQNPSYDDIQYSLTNTNQVTFNFIDQNDISADTGKIIANTQNNGDIHLNNIGTLKQTLEILNTSTQAFSTYSNNEIIDTLGRSRNITINNENTTIEFGKKYATENITDNQTNPLNIQFYQNITSSDFIISKTSDGIIEIHLIDSNDTSTGNIMITDKNNGVVNLNFNNNTIAINPLTYNFSTQNNLISTENLKLSTIPNVSQKNITINTIEQTKETYAGNSQNISHTTQSTLIPILNNQ